MVFAAQKKPGNCRKTERRSGGAGVAAGFALGAGAVVAGLGRDTEASSGRGAIGRL